MTAGEVPVPPAAVGIVMGSDSDWPVMEQAAIAVAEFDVPYEVDVVSAHRCRGRCWPTGSRRPVGAYA